MPLLLVFTKEIFKNTKENMPSEEICSHFSQEGQINLIFPPYCCICIALSIDTHMSYSESHIAVWLYGYMAIIWKYGHMAIWLVRQPIWMSFKKAIKMQQSGETLKLIRPSCEK